MKNILLGILAFIAVFLVSCNNSKAENTQIAVAKFTTGDIVPNDEVCMVNNAYMGKKQLEVKHDGKTYYGCCENCKKTLAEDPSARTAFDPISKKMVDKATAIIGARPDGSVVYFENKSTFKQYTQ